MGKLFQRMNMIQEDNNNSSEHTKHNGNGMKEYDVLGYVRYKNHNPEEIWREKEKPEIKRDQS